MKDLSEFTIHALRPSWLRTFHTVSPSLKGRAIHDVRTQLPRSHRPYWVYSLLVYLPRPPRHIPESSPKPIFPVDDDCLDLILEFVCLTDSEDPTRSQFSPVYEPRTRRLAQACRDLRSCALTNRRFRGPSQRLLARCVGLTNAPSATALVGRCADERFASSVRHLEIGERAFPHPLYDLPPPSDRLTPEDLRSLLSNAALLPSLHTLILQPHHGSDETPYRTPLLCAYQLTVSFLQSTHTIFRHLSKFRIHGGCTISTDNLCRLLLMMPDLKHFTCEGVQSADDPSKAQGFFQCSDHPPPPFSLEEYAEEFVSGRTFVDWVLSTSSTSLRRLHKCGGELGTLIERYGANLEHLTLCRIREDDPSWTFQPWMVYCSAIRQCPRLTHLGIQADAVSYPGAVEPSYIEACISALHPKAHLVEMTFMFCNVMPVDGDSFVGIGPRLDTLDHIEGLCLIPESTHLRGLTLVFMQCVFPDVPIAKIRRLGRICDEMRVRFACYGAGQGLSKFDIAS